MVSTRRPMPKAEPFPLWSSLLLTSSVQLVVLVLVPGQYTAEFLKVLSP